MNDQEAFLRALSENEDDTTTRLVYADWLDEHGQPEEAERQRKWNGAKEWIKGFAERIDQTYNRLMRAADVWDQYEDYTYDNDEVYKDHWEEFATFWEHWAIVKGRPTKNPQSFYTCSC